MINAVDLEEATVDASIATSTVDSSSSSSITSGWKRGKLGGWNDGGGGGGGRGGSSGMMSEPKRAAKKKHTIFEFCMEGGGGDETTKRKRGKVTAERGLWGLCKKSFSARITHFKHALNLIRYQETKSHLSVSDVRCFKSVLKHFEGNHKQIKLYTPFKVETGIFDPPTIMPGCHKNCLLQPQVVKGLLF